MKYDWITYADIHLPRKENGRTVYYVVVSKRLNSFCGKRNKKENKEN